MPQYFVPMIWVQCFSKDVPGRKSSKVLIKVQIPGPHSTYSVRPSGGGTRDNHSKNKPCRQFLGILKLITMGLEFNNLSSTCVVLHGHQ